MSHKPTTAVGRNWTYLRRVDCRPSRRITAIITALSLVFLTTAPKGVFATVDSAGSTADTNSWSNANVRAVNITASANGVLDSVGINMAAGSYNMVMGIYSDNAGNPGTLLGTSAVKAETTGWQDFDMSSGSIAITQGNIYWVAASHAGTSTHYTGPTGAYTKQTSDTYNGALPATFTVVNSIEWLMNVRMTYSVAPSKEVFIDGTSNITYDALETAYCHAPNYVCKLWRNATDITATENNTASLIHRGGWNYTASVTGNSTKSWVVVAMPAVGAAAPVYGISIDFITEKMQIVVR